MAFLVKDSEGQLHGVIDESGGIPSGNILDMEYIGPTVTITNPTNGVTQVWMKENLSVTHFRDGTPLRSGLSTSGEWSQINNNYETHPDYFLDGSRLLYSYHNEDNYDDESRSWAENTGFVYPLSTIQDKPGLAPKGWHIPSEDEWLLLLEGYGTDPYPFIQQGRTWSWSGSNPNSVNAWNATGLSLPPSGLRSWGGSFIYGGGQARFATTTKSSCAPGNGNGDPFDVRVVNVYPQGTGITIDDKSTLLADTASIRCIKDPPCVDAEGYIYDTCTIGSKHWMAESLRTKTYNDGTPILRMSWLEDGGIGGTAWYDSFWDDGPGYYCEPDDSLEQAEMVGLIYNLRTWMSGDAYNMPGVDISANLVPKGWRIPTISDFEDLKLQIDYTCIGAEENDFNTDPTTDDPDDHQGVLLAYPVLSDSDGYSGDALWEPSSALAQFNNQVHMGATGFNARPTAYRYAYAGGEGGLWMHHGKNCAMWCIDGPEGSFGLKTHCVIYYQGPGLYITQGLGSADGLQIRCCRDIDTID